LYEVNSLTGGLFSIFLLIKDLNLLAKVMILLTDIKKRVAWWRKYHFWSCCNGSDVLGKQMSVNQQYTYIKKNDMLYDKVLA